MNTTGAMEVQRRNNFVVGSDNTEKLFGGLSVCLGSWWNKTKQLSTRWKLFCFIAELDGDASSISLTPRFCRPRHRQAGDPAVSEPDSLHSGAVLSCVRVGQA